MLSCLLCAFAFSLLVAGPAPAAQTALVLQPAESLQYQIVPRQALPTSCGYAVCAAAIRLAACDVAFGTGDGTERSAAYPAPPPDSNLAVDEALLLARYGAVEGVDTPKRLSLAQISSILADFDVPSATLKGGLDNTILPLLKRGTPLIIHYERPVQHFALALGADADQIYVADPADGLTSLSYPELEQRMSGYFLVPLPFLRAPFRTMQLLTVTSNRTATSNAMVASNTTAPTNIEAAIAFIKDRNALLKTSTPVSVPGAGPALQKSGHFANANRYLRYALDMNLVALSPESESHIAPGILTSRLSANSLPLDPQLSFDIETPLGASFDIACKVLPLQPEFALSALYWTSDANGVWARLDARSTVDGWAFSPYLGHYASRLVSPALFTSKFGLGLELADRASHSNIDLPTVEPATSHSTGIKLANIALKSLLTVEYALTGSLSTCASLDQTFRYAIGNSSPAWSLATLQGLESNSRTNSALAQGARFFWDATVKGGIRLPIGDFVLSTGVIVGLSAYAPKGGIYVSVQH
ncbi:MAG TPA: cysteine peptidase family C39 domain-containing protein [Spirochaetales bacterium]|nr:cysteine peptidase family C39 domain-containing protein [Spirochaetales bacterium]